MTIEQLKQFQVIAELQNITKASNVLMVAQPALSRTVQYLENEYNTTFFDRVGKKIILNQKGEVFLKYVNNILKELHASEMEISEYTAQEEKTINLVVLAGSMLMYDFISKYKAIHPDVRVEIVQFDNWMLNSAAPDLTLTQSMHPIITDYSYTLLKERIMLAVPADSEIAEKEKIYLKEIAHIPLIALTNGTLIATMVNYHYSNAGLTPRAVMDHYTPTKIPDMICLGMGYAFIPEYTYKPAIDDRIKLLEIADSPMERYITVAWPKGAYLSTAAKDFRAYLIEYFEHLTSQKT